MKVAVAQIGTDPGSFTSNKNKILESIAAARAQGAELVVFPEGVVQGYAHLDLVYHKEFLLAIKQALQEIAEQTQGIAAIVGFVDAASFDGGPAGKPVLHNSAAVLQDGKIACVRDKTLLPEYDIFSEHRYFTPGTRTGLVDIHGKKVGIGICEDMWATGYREQVYPALIESGADLLVNISASPFHAGKQRERIEIINGIVKDKPTAFVYCNLVGSYDGYDGEVVFDGQSMVWNAAGELADLAPAFEESLSVTDIEKAPAIQYASGREESELYNALILGIKEYFRRCGFSKAFVGLSGGIDSALVAALCVAALGKEAVVGVTMPSHITSDETLSDAKVLGNNLGVRVDERPIAREFKAWKEDAQKAHGKELHTLTLQNKQARIRGSILMEYSNETPGSIVVSTGNKTELALGYCTLYGDMCGGFAAISDLSKERVYRLSYFVNELAAQEVIPLSIIEREPTAELAEGQTDAQNLPADYDILSPLVDLIIDEQLTREALIARYPADIVDKTLRLVRLNEFKRRQAAPGIRVTKKAFGIGRRIPMVHGFAG